MGDPDFCEKKCPICTRAREGNRFARFVQAVEMLVTFGGCPHGRARQRKYGVRPNEPIPPKSGVSIELTTCTDIDTSHRLFQS